MKKTLSLLLAICFPIASFCQLQNLDFELCDPNGEIPFNGVNCKYLEGWTRTNGGFLSETLGLGFMIGTVPEAQNGDMALRLSVFYNFDKDMAIQRAPFFSFPERLTGHYTYTDNVVSVNNSEETEEDFATVSVLLSKWNAILQKKDTIGYGKIQLGAASEYTLFSCPINYTSNITPDSITVLINPSRVRDETGVVSGFGPFIPECSYLTVDNLSLEGDALHLEEKFVPTWNVYPNPGSDIIHISDFQGDALLFDINGKLIENRSYPESEINISSLPNGFYLLHLREKSGRTYSVKYLKK